MSLQLKCKYRSQTSVTCSNSSTPNTYRRAQNTNRLNFLLNFFLYSASQAPDVCCALGKEKKNPPHRQKLRCCCDAVSRDAYAWGGGARQGKDRCCGQPTLMTGERTRGSYLRPAAAAAVAAAAARWSLICALRFSVKITGTTSSVSRSTLEKNSYTTDGSRSAHMHLTSPPY